MPDPQCKCGHQVFLKARKRPMLAAVSRHAPGNAQRNTINGRPRTRSGAEISIRISCCVMCTQNSCSPSSCSGESSAMTSEPQPRANQSNRHSDGRRWVVRRSIFVMPMPYRTAIINKGIQTKGGHVQSSASRRPVAVSDQAGVAVRTATAPATAT
jgi:hypothetical protein